MFRFLRTKRIRIKQPKYFLFTHVAASNCTAAGDSYTSTYLSEVRFTFEWLKGYTYRCKEIKDIRKNKTFRILAAEVSVGEGSSGAMVLGKLPVPGRPTHGKILGQGPTALAVGAGGVVLTFLLPSVVLSSFSPILGDGPI